MWLSSPSTFAAWSFFASAACASPSERSTGQPAVTAPATTNLMKSLRFALTTQSPHRFHYFHARLCSSIAHAQAVPNDDRHQRKHEDNGRDSINFWRDPPPQPSPDLKRQRVIPPNQKEADRDLIHGKREDQQRRANDR